MGKVEKVCELPDLGRPLLYPAFESIPCVLQLPFHSLPFGNFSIPFLDRFFQPFIQLRQCALRLEEFSVLASRIFIGRKQQVEYLWTVCGYVVVLPRQQYVYAASASCLLMETPVCDQILYAGNEMSFVIRFGDKVMRADLEPPQDIRRPVRAVTRMTGIPARFGSDIICLQSS